MRLVGRIILWFFATIGIGTAAFVAIMVFWLIGLDVSEPDLPDRMVLALDLNKGVTEAPSGSPFKLLSPDGPPSMRDILGALEKGAKDERVTGLAVRLGTSRVGVSEAQEIRDAVQKFRDSGKFAVAYADSFGMLRNATVEYYLAAAFEEVWMQPSGELALTGLAIELPFVAGALEKVGVEAKIGQRQEFKSAPETFTRRGLSGPARENLQQLVDSWFGQIVAGIAEGRGFEQQAVRAAVNQSPLLASEAKARKLIDKLDYWPRFVAAAKTRGGEKAAWVGFGRYTEEGDLPHKTGPSVALIYGIGPIVSGAGQGGLFDDRGTFAARTVARAISNAAKNKDIKAILLRIDSPGGSYLASDTVWNAVMQAREKGKPVIASLAGIAASGGYFVAMAADEIVAERGTVTGSIGVYGGKFVTQDLWSKLGINWQQIYAGNHATMWSPFVDYPPGAEARVDATLDFVYQDFTRKLAQGRKLTKAQVNAAARGRIWTGEAALGAGLVDRLGGLNMAIATVKEALDLKPEDSIHLKQFPRRRTALEQLLAILDDDEETIASAMAEWLGFGSLFSKTLENRLGPIAQDLELMRPPVGRLQMPPFRLRL